MFKLKNLYFVITSRSWKFCRMWYLDYHGFEVKPVRTPVANFGSPGVCIYGPASRHWLISYPPIHLT